MKYLVILLIVVFSGCNKPTSTNRAEVMKADGYSSECIGELFIEFNMDNSTVEGLEYTNHSGYETYRLFLDKCELERKYENNSTN